MTFAPNRAHDDMGRALQSLSKGGLILLHDSKSRENEVDMVVAAERVSPEYVGTMRRDAGGLLCLAVGARIGERLGLPYMRDIFRVAEKKYRVLKTLNEVRAPYGGKSAFSVTINHKRTFTGVTDKDRALTILEFANLCNKAALNDDDEELRQEFAAHFKAPGHVHLLLEAKGSLNQRRGHTELAVYLCKLARMSPAAGICEMLDGINHNALSVEDAAAYAKKHSIPLLDGQQVIAHFLKGARAS